MSNANRDPAKLGVPLIPLDEVARWPSPGMAYPTALAFSPDDRLITYLFSPGGDLVQQLFAFDPATGEHKPLVTPPGGGTTEENLSLEEALRRERQRQAGLGITPDWLSVSEPVRACRHLQNEATWG